MDHRTPLRGIYVPLVTPFAADGTIAAGALEELAHGALDQGAAGLAALGTTAEEAALDAAERRTVLRVTAAVCRERGATLLVGAGGSDTRRAGEALLALGEQAPEAAAAMVTVPAFSRPGEAGVVAHFRYLAGLSPVPLVIYHIPYRTGQPLGAAALLELAAVPGIAGVKYATGGIDQDTVELLGAAPGASPCWPGTTPSSPRCWRSAPPAASWPPPTWPPPASPSWPGPGWPATWSGPGRSATPWRAWPEPRSRRPIPP